MCLTINYAVTQNPMIIIIETYDRVPVSEIHVHQIIWQIVGIPFQESASTVSITN